MTKILTWLSGLIGVKLLKIGVTVFYFTAIFAFYYFMISSSIQFYNLVSDFMTYIKDGSSGDGSDTMMKFLGLLNCMGFIDAFNASKPTIFASIVFLFSKLGWRVSLSMKKEIVDKALKLI